MTADALKKITTDALDTLATLLDQGRSDQLTALLKTMARFHRYSWHNICLIASQCPTATRVAGFHTWRTMGRFVRKGESIAILAPIVGRRDSDAPERLARVLVFARGLFVDYLGLRARTTPAVGYGVENGGVVGSSLS